MPRKEMPGRDGPQAMVRGPRKGTREKAFAKRLGDALDKHPRCPDAYGRNTWLMRELAHYNLHVTVQTVTQWLAGATMPRRDRMTPLAKALRVDETWLAMGTQPVSLGDSDQRIIELEGALRKAAALTDNPKIHRIVSSVLGENVG